MACGPAWFAEETKNERHDKVDEAMEEEICALPKHDTWQLVPRPMNKQEVIDCKWVFKVKAKKKPVQRNIKHACSEGVSTEGGR